MTESILTTIKKLIGGMGEDDTAFDTDLIIHINTCFSVLAQIGVGPKEGFHITGKDETWSDFIQKDTKEYEMVKTYLYIKTKLVFDPPLSSAVMEVMKANASELEWRLKEVAESNDTE